MSSIEPVNVQDISGFAARIEENITDNDWDALSDVLKQRQQALEIHFAHLDLVPEEVASDTIKMIKKIQAEDAVFMLDLKDQKQKLEKQYLSFKQGRKSVKAYQQ
jgi:hypothetical protein